MQHRNTHTALSAHIQHYSVDPQTAPHCSNSCSARLLCHPQKSMAVPILKHQRLALHWMCCREVSTRVSGGILADDQGLGKTVTTLALILSHPRSGDYLVTEALAEEVSALTV